MRGTYLDYLFLLSYSTCIGLACVWAERVFGARQIQLAALGSALAWGQSTAALLDALENMALLSMLYSPAPSQPWPGVARLCAVAKFSLVILALLYVAGAGAVWIVAAVAGWS